MPGELIPIVFFLVSGAVLLTWIYFRSRERQLMLERGLTPEQIYEVYKSKKPSGTIWLKLGILTIFFGLGLGIGFLIEDENFMATSIFVFTGLGFVAAFFFGRKFDPKD